ncbi:MAG: hypothetical protein QOD42_742 [Sphingomonadales bacterium]|jgi:hypothetical protein|nr:hypothetical protein [Sphingomonadales bacterium]
MSNHRVIAAVTAALKQVLQTVAASVVGGVDIRLGPPTAKIGEETTPRINLFLFRISPNAALRNGHLPVRGSDGSRRRRAEAAVDLHYILSFYGDASAFVPEKLLGATTVALEEVPALFASAIAGAVAAVEPPVADPSVAAALERVRITPQTLTLEEFSKIWSIFFQVPYALSAVYLCSHVVLESQEVYGEAIPIVLREFLAGPVPGFSLLRAAADEAGTGPVLWGGPLHLAGKGLGKIGTGLSIDGKAMALDPDALSNGAIEIMLQAPLVDELAAGIHVVQAIAPKPTPATPEHLRRRTNAVSFALHPRITPGAVAANSIAVAFSPAVQEGQAVTLTLDARNAKGSPKVVLDPEPIDPNNPPAFPLGQLVFPFDALPAGDYLVRAQVDGIASLPDVVTDPNNPDFGLISGPLATVP